MLSAWRTSTGPQLASRTGHVRRLAVVASATRHACGAKSCSAAPSTSGRRPADRLRASASAGDEPPTSAPGAEGPLSPEDILNMVREQEEEYQAAESKRLTQPFLEDPEGLYDYVERAYAEGPRRANSPFNALMDDITGYPTLAYPAPVANDIVGMGTWRLKDAIDPILEFLVPRIEGSWREILDTDLCLYPRDKWKAKGWDLADSEDPQRELDGFSIADIPSPEEDAEGYPRVLLENRVYCSKVFRKLHVELCVRQDGMQVLHVVIYPRYSYDMPIFGLDIVLFGGRVTLAVADLCPVRKGLKLQPHYMETMALLQSTFLAKTNPASRRVPEWGRAIFSPLAVCISPQEPAELGAFVKYAVALHRAYLSMSLNAVPVVAGPGDRAAAERLVEILDGQKRFCDNQLANKKTRRVLETSFGAEWADEYMSQLMFDFDPSYEPPYFDASYERLYTYFDENPSFGDLAEENTALETEARGQRATEELAKAATGQPVSEQKLKLAMQFLLESDPTFRAAVQTLSSSQEVPTDDVLSDQLMSLLRSEGAAVRKG